MLLSQKTKDFLQFQVPKIGTARDLIALDLKIGFKIKVEPDKSLDLIVYIDDGINIRHSGNVYKYQGTG